MALGLRGATRGMTLRENRWWSVKGSVGRAVKRVGRLQPVPRPDPLATGRDSALLIFAPGRRHTMYESVTDLGDSLLLRLPGITGTAKQSGHVGEIEVAGVDLQRPLPKGTSSGKLLIVKRIDKASSALYQAFVKNTTFAEAVLTRLTLSNKEVAQLRFKNLVLRRLENMLPDQSAPHKKAQEYGQML